MIEAIRVSYGTAIVLGLANSRQEIPPTTAYLLWDPGCQGSCTFCPRNNGSSEENRLSRVVWPQFDFYEVIARLRNHQGILKRICLQTGWNPEFENQLFEIAPDLIATNKPVCVTLHPQQLNLAHRLFQLGIDRIGIGLDLASERSYETHKKRPWIEDFASVKKLVQKFHQKIEIHLIWGLGETEEEFIGMIDELVAGGAKIALFALTPMNDKNQKPPSISSFRRIQVFRYLREIGTKTFKDCRFQKGVLVEIPGGSEVFRGIRGEAFQTSGCPDCNRPFYNESPRGPWFSFPRPLTEEELLNALNESELFKVEYDFSEKPGHQ